ncbi:hypothetical protein DPMN_144264 [Dreissena polymorpha]|uniref:Uncharacterized protein n=1 Tax=Dreissena polymorpha TaxID=45954 RepID=A0A9D4JP07_DREPO|nr:hypothetical protein DPMN_144264 [Dreissena polymorpha]
MFRTSLAIEPLCSVCSKYEYEERLLEQILSNELAMKNTLNKITETHKQVEDSLKAITSSGLTVGRWLRDREVPGSNPA